MKKKNWLKRKNREKKSNSFFSVHYLFVSKISFCVHRLFSLVHILIIAYLWTRFWFDREQRKLYSVQYQCDHYCYYYHRNDWPLKILDWYYKKNKYFFCNIGYTKPNKPFFYTKTEEIGVYGRSQSFMTAFEHFFLGYFLGNLCYDPIIQLFPSIFSRFIPFPHSFIAYSYYRVDLLIYRSRSITVIIDVTGNFFISILYVIALDTEFKSRRNRLWFNVIIKCYIRQNNVI